MSNNNSNNSNGITFFGALTLIFIVLKLTNIIDWSWLWVLAPLWLPLSVFLGTLGIGFLVAYLVSIRR